MTEAAAVVIWLPWAVSVECGEVRFTDGCGTCLAERAAHNFHSFIAAQHVRHILVVAHQGKLCLGGGKGRAKEARGVKGAQGKL